MKHAQEVITELSAMKSRPFRVGDPVRFGGGSIHGRYSGTIKQLFKNKKASVSAKVRGVDKMFHPDFDDMTLVTEDLDEQSAAKVKKASGEMRKAGWKASFDGQGVVIIWKDGKKKQTLSPDDAEFIFDDAEEANVAPMDLALWLLKQGKGKINPQRSL